MQAVTNRFLETLKKPHKIATRCDLLSGGEVIDTLPLIDGNVTIDDVAIRTTATITVQDDGTLVPGDVHDPLAPLGNEIRLWRGIDYQDGSEELVPLGTFGLSDVKITDSGNGLNFQIDTYDRARRVSRGGLAGDLTITNGTPCEVAIQQLVLLGWSGAPFSFPSTGFTVPTTQIQQQADPWAEARKIAAAAGYDLFFDQMGICTMRQLPVTNPLVAVDYYEEGSDCKFMYVNKRLQDTSTYSAVVVSSESSSNAAPIRVEVLDTDPSSPTYVYGKYGYVPYFFTSSLITSYTQAVQVAQTLLKQKTGLMETLQLQTIVNPAHELRDVISVIRAKTKINALYTTDKLTIPMVHDRPNQVSTAERQVI